MIGGRFLSILRSPIGRVTTTLIGLGAVVFLLRRSGFHAVSITLLRAAPFFPWIVILEAAILACSTCALRTLYGEERKRIPIQAFFQAGLLGYAVMGLFPAGRAVAEATRAALLARYSTGARAAAVAVRLQAASLLANAAISFPATLAMFYVLGPSWPTILIAANLVITGTMGFAILAASRRLEIGKWIGRRLPSIGEFGGRLDQHLSSDERVPIASLALELLGRIFQVLQNAILVLAVGGAFGVLPALCSEALHLVGAATGDLIPAQLGATELSYRLSAAALAIKPSDALSIALLAHAVQLIWVAVGSLAPVLWTNPRVEPRASELPERGLFRG